MSQKLHVVFNNLHKFAEFLKKSVFIHSSMLFLDFIAFVTLYDGGNFQVIYTLTTFILILKVILLIFQGLMVHQLYQAKESDNSEHLLKAFQLMIGAILVGFITIFIRIGFLNLLLVGCQMILNLSVWKSLSTYLNADISRFEEKNLLVELLTGIKYYTNLIYITIGLFFFKWLGLLGNATGFLIFLGIIEVIAEIFIIYAQYKLANTMLDITNVESSGDKRATIPVKTDYRTFKQSNMDEVFDNPDYDSPLDENNNHPHKYCPMCGSINDKKAIYCIECGAKF